MFDNYFVSVIALLHWSICSCFCKNGNSLLSIHAPQTEKLKLRGREGIDEKIIGKKSRKGIRFVRKQ